MKKRFAIMRRPLEIGTFEDMCVVFYSCVAIHNFIRMEKGDDVTIDKEYEAEVQRELETQKVEDVLLAANDENREYYDWRDRIATAMWEDYVEYRRDIYNE